MPVPKKAQARAARIAFTIRAGSSYAEVGVTEMSATTKAFTPMIMIFRDDVWAGTGYIDQDGIIGDCEAVLGDDQDASDETYEAIQDGLDREPRDAGRYTGTGEVSRPDGVYSWVVTTPDPE